jgi:hypothetical protein
MQSEELLALTASEPLSMEEEKEMQRKSSLSSFMCTRLMGREMAYGRG